MNATLITHLFIAPFLCLVALISQRFPPKNINNFYGYRTFSSMKSPEHWKIANNYAPKVMLIIGLIDTALQVVFYFTLESTMSILASAVLLVISLPLLFLFTEQHLSNTIDAKSSTK